MIYDSGLFRRGGKEEHRIQFSFRGNGHYQRYSGKREAVCIRQLKKQLRSERDFMRRMCTRKRIGEGDGILGFLYSSKQQEPGVNGL